MLHVQEFAAQAPAAKEGLEAKPFKAREKGFQSVSYLFTRGCRNIPVALSGRSGIEDLIAGAFRLRASRTLEVFAEIRCGAMVSAHMLLCWIVTYVLVPTGEGRSYTLLEAIKDHKRLRKERVLEVVQTTSNINQQDEGGFTALTWAAWKADVEVLEAIAKR